MPIITSDTDTEVFILGDVPSASIEIFIPGDKKHSLTIDRMVISSINRQLDKEHGVSKIGDVTITFKNEDNQFSDLNASSIFFGKQILKDWVRIRSGWGPSWSNNIETQFQGRVKDFQEGSNWTATMIIYDALQDMLDTALNEEMTDVTSSGLAVNSSVVSSMNPIDILEYLVDTVFGLTWFDMDTLVDTDSLLDSTALALAKTATEGIKLGATTWPLGSKLLDMAVDIMKLVGGFIFSGKDGKINVYVFAPSQDTDTARGLFSFVGDVTTKESEITISRRKKVLKNIVNQIAWKYGQNDTEFTSESSSDSQDNFGVKTLTLNTGWELDNGDTYILDVMAGRLFARFERELPTYDLKIVWLKNGDGLALDLTNFVDVTDPALNISSESLECQRMQTDVEQQATQAVMFDTSALQGKFFFFSSEIDEGDGFGITGSDSATNWLRRFWFFSNEDTDNKPGHDQSGNANGTIEPTIAPIDAWGNGIEEHFVFW